MSQKKNPPQEVAISHARFLGEQDGRPERRLKERLVDFFRRDPSIHAAYLARITFGHPPDNIVALCLKTQSGEDAGLGGKIDLIFRSVFDDYEHLEIFYLNEREETELAKVCQPFFRCSGEAGTVVSEPGESKTETSGDSFRTGKLQASTEEVTRT